MSNIFSSQIAKDFKNLLEEIIKDDVKATYYPDWYVKKQNKEIKCTCGVKFTGGICSDWCDTNNTPPPTEEIPF